MYLYKLCLNLQCREVRRDLGSPYDMHSTLSRAFSEPISKCPPSAFLWRLEPMLHNQRNAVVLVQSLLQAEWSRITYRNWFSEMPEPPKILTERLSIDVLATGTRCRFRLRANPTVCRNGKRVGLMRREDYLPWLNRKATQHGFNIDGVVSSEEQLVRTKQHSGNIISFFSVLFDGILTVTEPQDFSRAISDGIGKAKSFGVGMLSVAVIDEHRVGTDAML